MFFGLCSSLPDFELNTVSDFATVFQFRQFLCGVWFQLKSTKRAEDGRTSAKHAQRMPYYPWILTLKEARASLR